MNWIRFTMLGHETEMVQRKYIFDSNSKYLQETKDLIGELERQLQSCADLNDHHLWSDVVKDDVVLVKGKSNPLSNVFPHKIIAFGSYII